MTRRLLLILTVVAAVAVALAGSLSAADKPLDPAAPQLGVAPVADKTPGAEEGVFGPSAVALRYAFSQGPGTYTEITGGTQLTTSCDDNSYNANNIGFSFTFDGNPYTQVSVNCNGFLAMGATVVSSYTPISTGTSNNVIAALARDLQTNTASSEVRYELLGTAPDQVFVVQWKNMKAWGSTGTGDYYNFQVRLYETSNRIEVVYGEFIKGATAQTVQVGLRGASSADFNNRTTTTNWAASTAGTSNTATMTLSTTVLPPNGLTYAWYLAPALVYGSSAVLGETCADGGPGENNGYIDPGETVDLNITLNNTGDLGATGVSAALSTTTPGVQVLANGAFYPDMPAGGSGTSLTAYQFVLDGAFPCGGSITFQLNITCNEASFVRTFTLNVGQSTVLYTENFDLATAPALPTGWAMVRTAGTTTTTAWATATGTVHPTGGGVHSAPNLAYFNSYTVSAPNAARLYQSVSGVDLSGATGTLVVEFWMYHDIGYTSADTVQVQLSTDAGTTWANVGAAVPRYDGSVGWKKHSVDITSYAGQPDVRLGFNATSAFGNDCHIDDVAVVEWTCYPCYGLWLSPGSANITGCPGITREQVFTLLNTTGGPGTFDLDYTVTDNALVDGPAELTLANGEQLPFTVELTPELCLPDGEVASVDIEASGYGYTDLSTFTESVSSNPYWVPIATEPDSGRMDNVAAAYDGLVWSITGYGANNMVRTYDPATDVWSVVAGSAPPFGVNYARSGCQHGSKVFIYGDTTTAGFGTTRLWSYDMATNTWTNEAPSGTPPTPTGLWAPAWVHDPDSGLCYLTGGSTSTSAGFQTTAYVYDPVGNAWLTPLPNFTTDRRFHAAFIFNRAIDGHRLLCLAGGISQASTYLSSAQCYDFVAAAWDPENEPVDMGPLPGTWWGMAYGDKWHFGTEHQLYLVGGVLAGGITNLSGYWDVDTTSGWWLGGSLATAPVYRVGMTTLDNQLYKVGGSIGSFNYRGLADHHIQCPRCEADLFILKDDGVDTAVIGETVTYTIEAFNPSLAQLDGVTVADAFPSALIDITWTCSGTNGAICTASGTGDINDTADLPPLSSVVYTATATVNPGVAPGTLVNTATATPPVGIPDPDLLNNSATDTDTLVYPTADLAITKDDGLTQVSPGQYVVYTIIATNSTGPSNVTGATVVDAFPPDLINVTWTCAGSGGGTCSAAGAGNINDSVNLPSGAAVVYTVNAQVDPAAEGVWWEGRQAIVNTANIYPPTGAPDPDLTNNSSTDVDTLVRLADVAITKDDGVTMVVPGDPVTYTITAVNLGPGDTLGAIVTDSFPAAILGVTWTCVGSGGGVCAPGGAGNLVDVAVLPFGGSVVYTATGTVSPDASGTIDNTANVAVTDVTDPDLGNNSATDSDTVFVDPMPFADGFESGDTSAWSATVP